jgi:outer membrane biosynthesis protein TonB
MRVDVYVNEQGQVVSDSTRLTPPTSNANFNQQILQNASSWRFRPARENNAPVAGWWFYVIDM